MPEKKPHPLNQAVKQLRLALGDTQQQFAHRLGLAISTVVRYELTRPPKGKALAQLQETAKTAGREDLWEVFRLALAQELGLDAAEGRVTIEVRRQYLAAHLALDDILKMRTKDDKARRILTLMKPYTEKHQRVVKVLDSLGGES